MDLNQEKLKKLSNNKIYEILKPIIIEIYKDYKFTNINEEELKRIVFDEIEKSKQKYDNKIKYEKYMKMNISRAMLFYTKSKLNDNNSTIDLINSYIDANFQNDKDYSICLNNLKKLNRFFEYFSYMYDIDLLINLINKNNKLSSTVEVIVKKYYNQIIEGKLDKITSNNFIILIIEACCIINDIEIKETEDDFDKDFNSQIDDVKLYLTDIGSIPVMTIEEEKELGYRLLENDEKARDEMIKKNLRLVVNIAKRYTKYPIAFLDLIQEGNLGLMDAVDRYDVRLGYRFSTYATCWIKQKIERSIAYNSHNIRMPVHVYEKIKKYKATQNYLEAKLHRPPKLQEIADHLQMSFEEIKKLQFIESDTTSLNTFVGESEDTMLGELVASDIETPEEIVLNESIQTNIRNLLNNCGLSDREIDVLTLRYGIGIDQTYTLEEIGKKYGLTRERIRQIEANGIMKLRKNKSTKELAVYTSNPDASLKNLEIFRKRYYGNWRNGLKTFLNEDKPRPNTETIYEYFKNYNKEEVDKVIASLSNLERALVYTKYGYNLNISARSKLTKEQSIDYFDIVVPKMLMRMKKNK